MKPAFKQKKRERSENKPMENGPSFRQLIVVIRAGDEVRLVIVGKFRRQKAFVNLTQVRLVRHRIDAEGVARSRRAERIKSGLVGREDQAATLAGQFALGGNLAPRG